MKLWGIIGLLVLVGLLHSGCQPLGRAAAKLYGYEGDPFPGACAPESLQAGYCIPMKKGRQQ